MKIVFRNDISRVRHWCSSIEISLSWDRLWKIREPHLLNVRVIIDVLERKKGGAKLKRLH